MPATTLSGMKAEPVSAEGARPAIGAKARMLRLLMREALVLLSDGQIPSVAEVAARAGVSRATAYRYFPSRSKLISAVVEHNLGPVPTLAAPTPAGRERV